MQLVTAKEAFGTNITIIHRRKFSSKSQDWKNQIFGTRLIPSHDLASFLPTAHSIPIGVTKYANGQLHVTVPLAPSPTVIMTPSHQAKLTIQGISITTAYTQQLIRAYIEPN